jgi:2-deoxy-D-gluconate 3-dehydrogenase
LVSGGSKGIGQAVAVVLAQAGADMAIVGRDRDGLADTASAVGAEGRECLVIEADMSTRDGPLDAAQKALAHFGTVDILVNNAGVALLGKLVEQSVDDWDRTQAVNLRAPFILARTLVPQMIARGGGKIVNVSSLSGVVGLEDHGAYCASKAGLNMLTKVMAVEWGPHNIQTNAIAPAVILTPMGEQVWGAPQKSQPMLAKIPMGRFGKPVEVADLVLFLTSPAADFICGDVVMIDGGYTAV